MTRRECLASLAALVVVGEFIGPTTYGYLDVGTALARGYNPARARVFLDGVDVTALNVQACDDRAGYIDILKRDSSGALVLHIDDAGNRKLARERRYGRVAVTFDGKERTP